MRVRGDVWIDLLFALRWREKAAVLTRLLATQQNPSLLQWIVAGSAADCLLLVRILAAPQGEFEEARQLIKRMGAENKLMHAILSRGRSLVGDLQGAMPGGNGAGASPALQSAVDALSGFLADARRLLDEQAALYRRFDELPNWRKGLTG